jgi:hypothetical protein
MPHSILCIHSIQALNRFKVYPLCIYKMVDPMEVLKRGSVISTKSFISIPVVHLKPPKSRSKSIVEAIIKKVT